MALLSPAFTLAGDIIYKVYYHFNRVQVMPRWVNFLLAASLLPICLIPILVLALIIKLTSPGAVVHWSSRVGKNNVLFKMPKFRTMRMDAPDVATHLLANPQDFITPIGGFLRKTSLDELPQLWSVFRGDMVFVGPRPALFNQQDLISLRTGQGLHQLNPGITGWAQINGRDALSIPDKVDLDAYYLQHRSFGLDLKILWRTFFAVGKSQGISH